MHSSKRLNSIPEEFNSLKMVPENIYYRGNPSLLKQRKISIVGSRKAYPYSRFVVHSLAQELSKREICIVSGAAMGIDAIAHEGAFPNTIAVLANGLDIAYPKVNKNLLESMMKNSLLISEYEDTIKAKPYSFVHRNRLVVALSEVLVVAQADLNSGSMRSVEYALDMGKKVYVIPHRLGESDGTTKLLEEKKAELITDIVAFADMFGESKEESDPFLIFCKTRPTYDEALKVDAQKLFEYELLGKIKILHGTINIT